VASLQAYYGASVVDASRNKCVTVAGSSGRLQADVVPSFEYRSYRYFRSHQNQGYIDGIRFFALSDGREIINFPKPHYHNGVGKSTQTLGRYKPIVRMFKNARARAVDDGILAQAVAPSYFLECFLYNAGHPSFLGTLQQAYQSILRSLETTNFALMSCQNGETALFGPTPEQWDSNSAVATVLALRAMWNNWH
jgi:hypothetical protein